MQPTTYPNVSNIYASGPSVVPSAASFNGPDVSDIYADPNQAAAQPAAAPHKKEGGNWLTNLFPTLGSMGGGAAGAVAGASLGSVVPIIGTGIGGVLGGILGAAAGGGGAKVAENAVEGNGLTDDVGNVALESGVGQAVGGVAGKVLGKGAQVLAGRAGKITTDATEAAAQKAAQQSEVSTAQAIRNNYGGIKPGVQSANNLEGNQQLLQQWGLDHTSPEIMQGASKGGLFINDIDQAALGAGKPIKTTDLISSRDITTASPEEQAALMSPKVGIITPDGRMPQTVTPLQAHAFGQDLNNQVRDLQSVAENAKANGNYTEYNAAKQHLSDLSSKYNSVQELASTPEVNAAVAARTISPEEKASLVEQFGQKQADHIEQAVNDAQTHTDLVKAKLPFAQMNNLSGLAMNDMKATGTARALARAKTDINGDGVADADAPVLPTAGDALTAAAGNGVHGGPTAMIAKALYQSKDNPAILKTLSRIGALGEKLAPATGAAMGAGNAQLQSNGDTMGGMMPPQQTDPSLAADSTVPQGGLTRNDLITLALYSPSAFNSLVAPSAANQQNVATANTAEQALSSLGPAPSGGIVSQLAGKFGLGATGEYQRKAAAAAQQVAAALPGADAGTIEKQLTNYMAGGASIDEAVQQLMQSLHATAQNNTNGSYQSLMNFNPSQPQSVVSAAGL
jgi:hypothetical protein